MITEAGWPGYSSEMPASPKGAVLQGDHGQILGRVERTLSDMLVGEGELVLTMLTHSPGLGAR